MKSTHMQEESKEIFNPISTSLFLILIFFFSQNFNTLFHTSPSQIQSL